MFWIMTRDDNYGLRVMEFKCSKCGHKETVHEVEKLPKTCYVCEDHDEGVRE